MEIGLAGICNLEFPAVENFVDLFLAGIEVHFHLEDFLFLFQQEERVPGID